MIVFVDTSVWFGAANVRDRNNGRAKEILATINAAYMTDHVLVETWGLLNSRVSRPAAQEFWLSARQRAEVEKVTPSDLETAWTIGQGFLDQDFSIVDLTSFVVMERLGIKKAASFDHHFAVYRYGRNRDQAFEILR